MFLATHDQLLSITTDDLSLMGSGVISSGASYTTLRCSTPGRTVGLGLGSGQLQISNAELGNMYAGGMTIGTPTVGSRRCEV